MTAFSTEAEFAGPNGWIVRCECHWQSTAPDAETAERLLVQHEIAHRVVEAHS